MSFWTHIFIWCLGCLSQSTAASGKITLSALKSLKNCVEAEILPAVTHLWKPKPEHCFHKMKLSGQAAIRDGLTTNHDNSKLFSLALKKSQKTEDWNQNSSSALLKYKQCSSIGAGTKSGTKELLCISWFNLSFNGVMTFPRAVWAHSCGQGGGRFALWMKPICRFSWGIIFTASEGGKDALTFLQSRDTFTLQESKAAQPPPG